MLQSLLKHRVSYCESTGTMVWKKWGKSVGVVGDEIGYLDKSTGYRKVRFSGRNHYTHRLVFLYVEGFLPKCKVDHINRDRADNRWSNLRKVTNNQNAQNRGIQKSNISGFIGVNKCARADLWISRIRTDNREVFLGRFKSKILAAQTYNLACKMYHGEFAVINEITLTNEGV